MGDEWIAGSHWQALAELMGGLGVAANWQEVAPRAPIRTCHPRVEWTGRRQREVPVMANGFQLLDVVALVADPPERGLVAGQVGTIVDNRGVKPAGSQQLWRAVFGICDGDDLIIALYGYSYGATIPRPKDAHPHDDRSHLTWDCWNAANYCKPIFAFVEKMREREESLEMLVMWLERRHTTWEFPGELEPIEKVRAALAMYLRGTRLRNRYAIEESIGAGAHGAVLRATDEDTGLLVAIKYLQNNDPRALRLFRQEAQILERLDHPSLPKYIDHFTEQGADYLVMEFVPGDDLATRLRTHGASLDLDEMLDLGERLLEVLKYLHGQGLTHLDIKPANINVTPEGRSSF